MKTLLLTLLLAICAYPALAADAPAPASAPVMASG